MEKEEIYLASDHAGFSTKEKLKKIFANKKLSFIDLGPEKFNKNDDYPDFAFSVAKAVAKNKNSKGILVCGTGIGMSIAANKINGIRAAAVSDITTAKLSREHNNSNVLAISGKNLSDKQLKKIVLVWLSTPFSKDARHRRRINKISKMEK